MPPQKNYIHLTEYMIIIFDNNYTEVNLYTSLPTSAILAAITDTQ